MPIKPAAWWTLYYSVIDFTCGQEHAIDMADRLYAAIEPFLKASGKKEGGA